MKRLSIIGSGVVGRATGIGFLSKGHEVIFYDIKKEIIENLCKSGYQAKHFNELEVNESDIFFFVLPTPTEKGKINLSYIKIAAKYLGRKLKERKKYFVIVVRSTVPPGTTEEIAQIIQKESGKKTGKDFGVSMNPEYLREASANEDFKNPWLITIGSMDKKTKRIMSEVYCNLKCPVHHVSIREAEMQKYIHNLYNAVKIAFFNEMRMVADKIGIIPEKIFSITADSSEAFWNKYYGLKDAGPFDGMCLPKDTQAFLAWSKKNKIKMDVLRGVISSNDAFAEFWANKRNNKKV